MSAAQRQPQPPAARTTRRPEYIAAVRYPDGRRDLFHIVNANDLADARELVLLEVGDVRSLLIAERN
ncbi:MAG: hypothetical protein PHT48_04850 [Dechloromonas sp.]|nr:hypothetical protein [Dechloromonas sp.]